MKRLGFRLRRRGLPAAAIACAALGFASAASAATYTVNDTHDFAQDPHAASGACQSTAGTCTLRAAVQASDENGGANTINAPAGTYNLTASSSNGTDTCTPAGASEDQSFGSLKVNSCDNSTQVTVIGAGSGATVINGENTYRIFELWPNGTLDLQKMTLENGDGVGSDYSTSPDVLPDGDGGAVVSNGHLSAESVTFTGNSASNGGGGVAAEDISGSTASVTGSVFQNNVALIGGGFGTEAPNDVTISFSLFQDNSGTNFGGGAIFGDDGAAGLTLNFDDLVQNVAAGSKGGFGGGIYWKGDGPLNVADSLFSQNQATDGAGGGIYNGADANVSLSSTSFDGNSAKFGGGVDDGDGFEGSNGLTLTQDKFSGDTASTDGGALLLESVEQPTTTILSSEFDGNSAPNDVGGAIQWAAGPLVLEGTSFVLNTAANGGALSDFASVNTRAGTVYLPLAMYDTTMSRNSATQAGGAVLDGSQSTPVTMINNTIAFNNAASASGAGIDGADLFTAGGSSSTGFGVENTTIAENSGGDCLTAFAASVDQGNNNDSDQTCFGGLAGPNDKTGVNPLLANPANNGGPAAGGPGDTETVQTDAEQSNSPLIDAGDNNGCPAVDERGVKRPQGAACDIGAYEFGANPLTTSTTTTGVTSTSTSRTTLTSTTTTHKPTKKPRKKCAKGKVRKHGKCVKKHKKHHKRHKRK